ncbi:MAG: hypothetical protein PHQ86_04665 [Dehalococcoidales bacterium]|nr:hypothetical protein [Dehalococcoidales bacterium]
MNPDTQNRNHQEPMMDEADDFFQAILSVISVVGSLAFHISVVT